jgi:hypothetical protein
MLCPVHKIMRLAFSWDEVDSVGISLDRCPHLHLGFVSASLFPTLTLETYPTKLNFFILIEERRSQWPRGLGYELSLPAPALRSWVRIPLEAWMFVCVLCAFILCLPSVEAGKNTSTVIPATRKRRQKGNPVVSGETVPADLRGG